jgi:transposase
MVAAALRGDEKDASPAQNVFLGSESVHSWVRYKRLERGRFIWPQATSGTVSLSRAQLSMLLEGIDWRRPDRTWQPPMAV